jgi:hypothetical protein
MFVLKIRFDFHQTSFLNQIFNFIEGRGVGLGYSALKG